MQDYDSQFNKLNGAQVAGRKLHLSFRRYQLKMDKSWQEVEGCEVLSAAQAIPHLTAVASGFAGHHGRVELLEGIQYWLDLSFEAEQLAVILLGAWLENVDEIYDFSPTKIEQVEYWLDTRCTENARLNSIRENGALLYDEIGYELMRLWNLRVEQGACAELVG